MKFLNWIPAFSTLFGQDLTLLAISLYTNQILPYVQLLPGSFHGGRKWIYMELSLIGAGKVWHTIGLVKWLLTVFLGAKVNVCTVYFSYFNERLTKQKRYYHSHRSTLIWNHSSLSSKYSHSLLQDQMQFLILMSLLFCHDSIYLYLRCVFIFALHLCPFHWIVILCAAVENCYWWCMCGFCELPLSSSLIWHVSTSCRTSRGGRSPNVNVWKVTGTSNRLRAVP